MFGQIRSGWVWLDQVRSVYFRLIQDSSIYFTLDRVFEGLLMLGKVT